MNQSPILKIVSYKTIKSNSPEGLDMQIKTFLQEGWQPYGSPYTSINGGTTNWAHQVMVKYESSLENTNHHPSISATH
jgi:hypothetical protein